MLGVRLVARRSETINVRTTPVRRRHVALARSFYVVRQSGLMKTGELHRDEVHAAGNRTADPWHSVQRAVGEHGAAVPLSRDARSTSARTRCRLSPDTFTHRGTPRMANAIHDAASNPELNLTRQVARSLHFGS